VRRRARQAPAARSTPAGFRLLVNLLQELFSERDHPPAMLGRQVEFLELSQILTAETSADVRVHEIVFDDAQPPRHFFVGDAQLVDALDVPLRQELEEIPYQLLVAVPCFV
jgi:hypothetical protein